MGSSFPDEFLICLLLFRSRYGGTAAGRVRRSCKKKRASQGAKGPAATDRQLLPEWCLASGSDGSAARITRIFSVGHDGF